MKRILRADGWYRWRVEEHKKQPIRVTGVPGTKAADVFAVAFRTNPSHLLSEIVPGVGITRFEFEHHGTTASADVRLIQFKRTPLPQSLNKTDFSAQNSLAK